MITKLVFKLEAPLNLVAVLLAGEPVGINLQWDCDEDPRAHGEFDIFVREVSGPVPGEWKLAAISEGPVSHSADVIYSDSGDAVPLEAGKTYDFSVVTYGGKFPITEDSDYSIPVRVTFLA